MRLTLASSAPTHTQNATSITMHGTKEWSQRATAPAATLAISANHLIHFIGGSIGARSGGSK